MVKLTEGNAWVDDLYQLETTDPVEGGPDGIDNLQAKQLGSRTQYLKQQVEQLNSASDTHKNEADPHPQYMLPSEAIANFAEKNHTHPSPNPADIGAVKKDGDTMSGPLILSGEPTQNNGAATKAYVDNKFAQSQAVRQPNNMTPANSAVSISTTSSLQANAYYSLYGIAQSAAQFQISTVADFSTTVRDVTLGAVNAWAITPALTANTAYFWRVRFKDAENVWSAWSAPTQFSTGSIAITTPTLTNPTANQTGVATNLTLSSSAFAVTGGSDSHASSRWQVASDAAFNSVLFDSGVSAANKTSFTLPSNLSFGTMYYARVQHTGTTYGSSPWSPTQTFTTLTGSVSTPTITSPTSGTVNTSLTPTVTTSAFATSGAADTHAATDWEVRTADNGGGALVWSSANNTTNKVNINVGSGLANLTQYFVRARHKGTNFGYGPWSNSVSFTTQVAAGEQIFSSPGAHTLTVGAGVTSLSLAVVSGEGSVPTSIGTYSAVGGLNPLIQDLPALPVDVNPANTSWGNDLGNVVSSNSTVLALIASRSYLRKTSYAGEWAKLQLPDAYEGAVIDPNSNIASAFGNNKFYVSIASKLFVSSDEGLTWDWYPCPDFISLAMAKFNNAYYLVGMGQNGSIYISSDGGANFNSVTNLDSVWSGGWSNLVGFGLASNYAGVLLAIRNGNGSGIAYSFNAGQTWSKVTVPQGFWSEVAQSGNGVIITQQSGNTGLYLNATFNGSTGLVNGFDAPIQTTLPICRIPQGAGISYSGVTQTLGLDGTDYSQITILNSVTKINASTVSINSAKANSKLLGAVGANNTSRLVHTSWGVVIINLSSTPRKSITLAPVIPQVTNLNAFLSGVGSTSAGEAGSATKDGIGISPNLSASGSYGGSSAGYKNNVSVTPGQQFSVVIPNGGAVRVIWGAGRSFPSNAA